MFSGSMIKNTDTVFNSNKNDDARCLSKRVDKISVTRAMILIYVYFVLGIHLLIIRFNVLHKFLSAIIFYCELAMNANYLLPFSSLSSRNKGQQLCLICNNKDLHHPKRVCNHKANGAAFTTSKYLRRSC